MKTRTLHRRAAFTLVEVMLAIAIFSIVLAAIYGTWRAIIGATRSGQIAAEEVQRKRVALRCLEQAVTYTEMFAANADYYAFVAENGSAATLSFVARLPKDFPRSGRFGDLAVRRVMFALEPAPEGGNNLVMRQAPVLSEFDLDEQEHPLVLMHHVRKMEMEFFDLQAQDWVDQWDQTNQVPKLIRIEITTDDLRDSFDGSEQIVQVIAPASAAVQAVMQGGAPGQQPGQARGIRPPPVRQ